MVKKNPIYFLYLLNFAFIFLIILFVLHKNTSNTPNIIINQESSPNNLLVKPNYAYSNLPEDVLLNPYVPPLKDERYLTMPINVSTNLGAVDTSYRQIGILTPANDKLQGKILPLMGRPLFVNRNKWQYYTLSDQNNSVKLPIVKNGRSCTNEYGCDQLYDGDSLHVEGYNQTFKITMYDNNTIKYLPYM